MQGKSNTYVMQVQTNADSIFSFNDKYPGIMKDDKVIGPKLILLQNFTFDSIRYGKGTTPKYVFYNGTGYPVNLNNSGNGYIFIKSDSLSIPFSDIKQMQIKKLSKEKLVALVVGGSCAVGGLALLIVINLINSLDTIL